MSDDNLGNQSFDDISAELDFFLVEEGRIEDEALLDIIDLDFQHDEMLQRLLPLIAKNQILGHGIDPLSINYLDLSQMVFTDDYDNPLYDFSHQAVSVVLTLGMHEMASSEPLPERVAREVLKAAVNDCNTPEEAFAWSLVVEEVYGQPLLPDDDTERLMEIVQIKAASRVESYLSSSRSPIALEIRSQVQSALEDLFGSNDATEDLARTIWRIGSHSANFGSSYDLEGHLGNEVSRHLYGNITLDDAKRMIEVVIATYESDED